MTTRQRSVTERLREMVLSGEIAPGEHLLEVPLSHRLGVSRTPIRAALGALAQEGLLLQRGARGYAARQFSLKEALDAYRVRGTIEGLACRILAEQGLDRDTRAKLQDCLAEGDAILATGELTEVGNAPWRAMNDRLHQTILAATGNACLLEVTARTLAQPMVSSRTVHWYDFEAIRRSHDFHHWIVDAIASGQGDRADALMREHIHQATVIIRQVHERLSADPIRAAI